MATTDTLTEAAHVVEKAATHVLPDKIFSVQGILELLNYTLFRIGDTAITLSGLAGAVLIFVAFLILSAFLQRLINPLLNKRLERSPGVAYAISRFIHYLVVLIGLSMAGKLVGVDMSSFAIVVGFLSVGIGFGLQNITSNFISGLILLIERPISVGDLVEVEGHIGRVLDIRMRATLINTLDNVAIIVPNSLFIQNKVVNWSHGDLRIRLHAGVGVAYGSDLELVRETLLQVAREHQEVLERPVPEVRFISFGDSSLNMDLLAWIANPGRQYIVQSELNFAIDAAFRKAGISIPFPQRDLHVMPGPAIDALAAGRER